MAGSLGRSDGAATALEQLHHYALRVLGLDHRITINIRANLAWWQGETGNPAGAAAAYQDVLDHRLYVLGPDHPDTAITRANLEYWRGITEAPDGAPEHRGPSGTAPSPRASSP